MTTIQCRHRPADQNIHDQAPSHDARRLCAGVASSWQGFSIPRATSTAAMVVERAPTTIKGGNTPPLHFPERGSVDPKSASRVRVLAIESPGRRVGAALLWLQCRSAISAVTAQPLENSRWGQSAALFVAAGFAVPIHRPLSPVIPPRYGARNDRRTYRAT